MNDIEPLIAEVRKWTREDADTAPQNLRRLALHLADALEATAKGRDEFRDAWNAQGFEIIRLEDERGEAARLSHEFRNQRDRYRDAIRDALDVKMFKVGVHSYGYEYQVKVQRILAQVLKGES